VARVPFSSLALPAVLTLLSRLFLGANGDRDSNQAVHVERAVDVGYVSERSVGATDDSVHFADVGAVVGSDHDGVQGWR